MVYTIPKWFPMLAFRHWVGNIFVQILELKKAQGFGSCGLVQGERLGLWWIYNYV